MLGDYLYYKYVVVLLCTLVNPLIIVINLCSTDKPLVIYVFTGEKTDQSCSLNLLWLYVFVQGQIGRQPRLYWSLNFLIKCHR